MSGNGAYGDTYGASENEAAWNFVGYPGLSRLMASTNDCFAMRKFGTLNVRVLLKLQNDIVLKERELHRMDQFSKENQIGCGSLRVDAMGPRGALMDEIADLIKDYNERLAIFLQLHDRPIVAPSQVQNLQAWFECFPNAVETSEQEFLRHEGDLICNRVAQRTLFGVLMESLGASRIASMGSKGNDPAKYYNRNIWKNYGSNALEFITLGMLLGPLWAMAFADTIRFRLIVVSVATVLVGILISLGTHVKASHRNLLVAGYFAITVLLLHVPTWSQAPLSSTITSYNTTITAQRSPTTIYVTHTLTETAKRSPTSPLNFTAEYHSFSKMIGSDIRTLSEFAATAKGTFLSEARSEIRSLKSLQSDEYAGFSPITSLASYSFSTSAVQSHTASSSAAPTSSTNSHGGLTTANKIGLGVGIGLGLPATLASLWVCCRVRYKR